MSDDLEFFGFDTGEVELNVATMGDRSSPVILALHGFPEYWAAWLPVMRHLSDTYRVILPDQRGYNLSGKRPGVDTYRTGRLVSDMEQLGNAMSPGRPFILAGHDWGASVAYALAFRRPERLSHLIVANGAHPWCFQNAILHDEDQRRASQYISEFREDGAEGAMSADGFARTFGMVDRLSCAEWQTPAEKARYLAAWSQPGAMEAMLNWYRAAPLVVPRPGEPAHDAPMLAGSVDTMTVRVPHLLLWGDGDLALRPATLNGLERFAPDLTVRHFAGTGHWILHEKPDEVAGAIREFITPAGRTPPSEKG